MAKQKMSDNGAKFLKRWEGSKPKVYLDVAGFPTIGVGHLLTRAERMSGKIWIRGRNVRYANGLSDEEITQLLQQDVVKTERSVNKHVTVGLTQNQFDTLVSFTFNIGSTAFRKSTLVKLLNQGEYKEVPAQLKRWKYSGGKIIKGLINRRRAEAKLWNKK